MSFFYYMFRSFFSYIKCLLIASIAIMVIFIAITQFLISSTRQRTLCREQGKINVPNQLPII